MKILFACHRFPFPPNRGGKIRPFNMIRHLSQKHEVFVASLAHTQQELNDGAGLREYCADIYAEVVPEHVRRLQAARALMTVTPSSVAYFRSWRLGRRIEDVIRNIFFDAVIVHCAFAAQYVVEVPAKFRLMDFGDMDSGKWLDYSRWRAFPLSWAYHLEGHKLRGYEKQIAQSFDYCTVTTQGEREEFKKLNADVPLNVIPNGVDTGYFQPRPEQQYGNVIAFVGRMDYFPNIDGIVYFAERIFPIIRQNVPDAELNIVGSDPSRAVRDLATIPGIKVTGHVADVRSYLQHAKIAVAPLRMARGTQNKILESMAMGIPVVATPEAAKGIDAIPARHLLIASEAQQFAQQVIRVLKDERLREDLSDAGCRRVKDAHSWSRSLQLLDGILESLKKPQPEPIAHMVT
jgi:sugar transferase (PEP-CTERM/EpsH1 system associated)